MSDRKLMEQIFNLKFTSKQLVRGSKRAEKDEKSEKLKVKKAIEKGNIDGAKIYAQARTVAPLRRESVFQHHALARQDRRVSSSSVSVIHL